MASYVGHLLPGLNRRVSLAGFYSTDPIAAGYRGSNNSDDDDENDGDDDDHDDDDDDGDDDEGCSARKYKISASPQQQTVKWCRISQ